MEGGALWGLVASMGILGWMILGNGWPHLSQRVAYWKPKEESWIGRHILPPLVGKQYGQVGKVFLISSIMASFFASVTASSFPTLSNRGRPGA